MGENKTAYHQFEKKHKLQKKCQPQPTTTQLNKPKPKSPTQNYNEKEQSPTKVEKTIMTVT